MDIVEGDPDYGTPLAYLLEQHASAFIYLRGSWILSNIFEAWDNNFTQSLKTFLKLYMYTVRLKLFALLNISKSTWH